MRALAGAVVLGVAVALAACAGAPARSGVAKRAFAREVACPATGLHALPCPGYVVDHVVPLACGGADAPPNMQWQTVPEARAKDRWERSGCARR